MKCDTLTEYFTIKNLREEESVRTFIRMRLNILLKSYEKSQVSELDDHQNSDILNNLFIKRLLQAEKRLLRETLEII